MLVEISSTDDGSMDSFGEREHIAPSDAVVADAIHKAARQMNA